jgi:hypothetical protein
MIRDTLVNLFLAVKHLSPAIRAGGPIWSYADGSGAVQRLDHAFDFQV